MNNLDDNVESRNQNTNSASAIVRHLLDNSAFITTYNSITFSDRETSNNEYSRPSLSQNTNLHIVSKNSIIHSYYFQLFISTGRKYHYPGVIFQAYGEYLIFFFFLFFFFFFDGHYTKSHSSYIN